MGLGPLWQILWVLAAAVTGILMLGAWTGPHRSVSNLSRWATRLGVRHLPAGFERRATDRLVFRGGLVCLALLLAIAWLVPSPTPQAPSAPRVAPATAPAPVSGPPVDAAQRPARHLDAELRSAILVHIPKSKQVRLVVLKDDPEADQFSWEIDAFLRLENYTVMPRLLFAIAEGGKTPVGTSLYPDDKNPNVVVIRIGLNDRS